jgi:tetratricopeptide (TPR) repeat protein
MKFLTGVVPWIVAVLFVPWPAWAQHEHHEQSASTALTTNGIGAVDFQTSCKPAVKDTFNRAVSMLHSFWFGESRAAFQEALATDPECAIAHWGIALTHWGNPFVGLRMPQTIAIGKTAIDLGRTTGRFSVRLRLEELRDRELEMKDAYWAGIIDIQRQGAAAWLLFAQGKANEALDAMRAAADAEDATDKSAVTPGPLAPAREMLGFMLLEAGKPEEALAAFDTAIAKEPNRFLALYGAGRAAEQAQQGERAKRYYRQITTICKDAPSDRPELVYARKQAL